MKAAKFVSLICAVTMIMSAGALNFSASAESSTALSAGSGMVPDELAYFDGYMGEPEPFTKGIWLYTTKSSEKRTVDAGNLEGFFCFTSDSEGCRISTGTGEVIPFTFTKNDDGSITFRFAGNDGDSTCKITEKGYIFEEDRDSGRNEDWVAAEITSGDNAKAYTFNYGKPDAKEFLEKFYSDGMVPEELYEADGRNDDADDGMVPEELYETDGRDDTVNDGMVPEELYETDGRDDTVKDGMVPEELYETDGRDDNVNPGTGFKGFAAAIAVTGACGAAAVAAYKFGKKK